MEPGGLVVLELIPFILFVILFLVIALLTKMKKSKNSAVNGKKPTAVQTSKPKLPPVNAATDYTFCPYCNTKIEKSQTRPCLVCHTIHLCPKCHKCANRDQHGGR